MARLLPPGERRRGGGVVIGVPSYIITVAFVVCSPHWQETQPRRALLPQLLARCDIAIISSRAARSKRSCRLPSGPPAAPTRPLCAAPRPSRAQRRGADARQTTIVERSGDEHAEGFGRLQSSARAPRRRRGPSRPRPRASEGPPTPSPGLETTAQGRGMKSSHDTNCSHPQARCRSYAQSSERGGRGARTGAGAHLCRRRKLRV